MPCHAVMRKQAAQNSTIKKRMANVWRVQGLSVTLQPITHHSAKGQIITNKITTSKEMKKGIHPENYRPVVFKDMSNGDMFLSKSTCKSNETVEFEGETYPLVKLEISSTSHPFYTGKSKLVDTAGRVDRFMSRYAKSTSKK